MEVGGGRTGAAAFVGLVLFASSACSAGPSAPATSDDARDAGDAGNAGKHTDGGAPPGDVTGPLSYPAFTPEVAQLQKGSLAPIASPVVVPVYFTGETDQTTVDTTLSTWIASSYFRGAVSEYGVGAGAMGTSIVLAETPPATMTQDDVDAFVKAKLDGTHPEMGPIDAATLASKIFVFFMPPATTVTFDGTTSCKDFASYHAGATLAGGAVANYVVMPRCPALPGDAIQTDWLTASATQMIVAAATNPVPSLAATSEGWAGYDANHFAFELEFGREVGTACAVYLPVKPADLGVAIGRTWSNAAAAAYHEPCIPAKDTQPYFVAAPSLGTAVSISGVTTKGVVVLPASSMKIDLRLFSDAPTHADWAVTVDTGGSPGFHFTVLPGSGRNGDVLSLVIDNVGATAPVPFVVRSQLGTRNTLWAGVASPK
jgi:hypothetical protein